MMPTTLSSATKLSTGGQISETTHVASPEFGSAPLLLRVPDFRASRQAESHPEPSVPETPPPYSEHENPPTETVEPSVPRLSKESVAAALAKANRQFPPVAVLAIIMLVGLLLVLVLRSNDSGAAPSDAIVSTPAVSAPTIEMPSPPEAAPSQPSETLAPPISVARKPEAEMRPSSVQQATSDMPSVSPWPRPDHPSGVSAGADDGGEPPVFSPWPAPNRADSDSPPPDRQPAAARHPVYEARRIVPEPSGRPAELEGTISKPSGGRL